LLYSVFSERLGLVITVTNGKDWHVNFPFYRARKSNGWVGCERRVEFFSLVRKVLGEAPHIHNILSVLFFKHASF
jgi:hypothetical protein